MLKSVENENPTQDDIRQQEEYSRRLKSPRQKNDGGKK
jgi:hypothetical protein